MKPSNVIVTPEDHAYLTDFGLAKRAETDPGLTAADQMLGTVDYVAPELIEGSEPDARSDIYSLGGVLYEMLAGEAPFAGHRGGMAKMWAQVNAEPTPLGERRPDVPRGIDALVRQAMSKDPAQRPTAEEFAVEALTAIGEVAVADPRMRRLAIGVRACRLRSGAVEQPRRQHDPPERHPGRAVVRRHRADRSPPRRRAGRRAPPFGRPRPRRPQRPPAPPDAPSVRSADRERV